MNDELASRLSSALEGYDIVTSDPSAWRTAIDEHPSLVGFEHRGYRHRYLVISPSAGLDAEIVRRFVDDYDLNPEGHPILVARDRIAPKKAAEYRELGFDYIDSTGNARIRLDNLFVDVQGRSPSPAREKPHSIGTSTNLFSARRAQVIFAVLSWPELLRMPTRVVSQVAGVSVGQAFQTVQLLKEEGYIAEENASRILRKADLIDRWTAAYSTGLQPKTLIGTFHGDIDSENLPPNPAQSEFLVSGESAIPWLIRPTTLTLYVQELDPAFLSTNRWRSDPHGNVTIRRQFWTEPHVVLSSAPEDRNAPWGRARPEVPALLIYADLVASGDARQREVADVFRQEHRGFLDH